MTATCAIASNCALSVAGPETEKAQEKRRKIRGLGISWKGFQKYDGCRRLAWNESDGNPGERGNSGQSPFAAGEGEQPVIYHSLVRRAHFGLSLRGRAPDRKSHVDQTYVPALQSQARPDARVSRADADPRGPRCDQGASRQRPQTPRGLRTVRPTVSSADCAVRTSVVAVARSQRSSASGRFVFRPAHRLCTPAEFAHVLAAAPADSLRASEGRLSMKALVSRQHASRQHATPAAARVRLGITVGKRNARRAVDRALIKRIVREAFRAVRPGLEKALGAGSLDINVRLSTPLGAGREEAAAGAARASVTQLRRSVRGDADRLFGHLMRRLPTQEGGLEPGAHDRGASEPA